MPLYTPINNLMSLYIVTTAYHQIKVDIVVIFAMESGAKRELYLAQQCINK